MTARALVVAAGSGSRLGELGRQYSKPMVPILGRPLIGRVLDRLARAGFTSIGAVVHPENTALLGYLQTQYPEIRLAYQHERRGMADAVACGLPLLDDTPYLACACDSLFRSEDIALVAALGREHPGSAAIGVLGMGVEATASRSAVLLRGTRVVEIHEKPAPGTARTGLVGMPLYWLPRRLDPFLRMPPANGRERQVAEALADFITSGGEVRAAEIHERLEVTRAEDVGAVEEALRHQRSD